MSVDMFAMPMTRGELPHAELVLLPLPAAARAQQLLTVEFRSPDARSWNPIGGGDTHAEAIEWARESCPRHTIWQAVGWQDRYGE